jgi:acetyl esterase
MKKIVSGLILLVAAIAGAALLVVNGWRDTPQGRLTLPSALISRLAALQESAQNNASAVELRQTRKDSIRFFARADLPIGNVENKSIPGPGGPIPIRIYTPRDIAKPLPVIVYFHGGGWVFGDLDSHDNLCRALATKTSAIVIAVDYRLAPEHRFPAAVDDALAAVHWVAKEGASIGADVTRIAVSGDSAGGNLAAAVSLAVRDQGGPAIRAQALIYPATDITNQNRASARDFARGFFLTSERMNWFFDHYVPDKAMRSNPLASPLLAADHHHLPPALVITAQFDPLRDEGEAYADVLKRAGVPVQLRRFEGVIHGFASMDRWFPESQEATDLIADYLKAQFGPKNSQ